MRLLRPLTALALAFSLSGLPFHAVTPAVPVTGPQSPQTEIVRSLPASGYGGICWIKWLCF